MTRLAGRIGNAARADYAGGMSQVMTEIRAADRETIAPRTQEHDAPPIDLEYAIETPENVTLAYRLAGPALRLAAWFVDLLIRIGFILGFAIVGGPVLGVIGEGFSAAVFLILWFVFDWFYFAISEGFFRGKTIGKQLFGLRVIHEEGYPITVWGAVLRNFVRAGDSVSLYGACLVTMLASGRFRRLGDLAARTLVIEERHVQAPREPVIIEKIEPLPRSELSGWVPAARTLSVIEQFLSRRSVLTYRRGHAMAEVLSRALASKLRYAGDPQLVEKYPMAFLARVYATFYRVRDESDAGPEARQ